MHRIQFYFRLLKDYLQKLKSYLNHLVLKSTMLKRNMNSQFSTVQWLSRVWLCDPMDCSMPGLPVHRNPRSLLKLMSIESVMPSIHLILCRLLLLLPPILPSIRLFPNESVLLIRWPKYGSFSFSISHSSEYSGLICFRMDWFDLLAVQGTLKNLQRKSSKHQFFGAQRSL